MNPLNGKMPTVLVVDDTPDNVALLCSILRGAYRTKVATDGEKALRIAAALSDEGGTQA